eukprot:gene11368-23793_t
MSSKLPVTVVLVWTILTIIIYIFFLDVQQPPTLSTDKLHDGIVFITMGQLAETSMIDLSIASIRNIGRWRSGIYIITDKPNCFTNAVKQYGVSIITAPETTSLIAIKAMKANVFKYLPANINSVLYLDSDILVTRNLNSYFRDIHVVLQSQFNTAWNHTDSSIGFDIGLFRDSKGHFVGFCSGCDKWHTGVIWLRRNQGTECLLAWERILRSGKYSTDQESMDEAEQQQACKHILTFPSRHLMFAKDYIALALTSDRTFLHLTAVSRIETQDYFYREIIAPWLMSSVANRLDRFRYRTSRKTCEPPPGDELQAVVGKKDAVGG